MAHKKYGKNWTPKNIIFHNGPKMLQKHRKLVLCAHPSAARTDRRLHRPSYEPRTVHVGIDLVGGPRNERPNSGNRQKPGFYAKWAIRAALRLAVFK